MRSRLNHLRSWEGLLAIILGVVLAANVVRFPDIYLNGQNLINLFQLHIEKIIVALVMTLVIINGEIDLSVASVMGLSASILAYLFQQGVSIEVGVIVALLVGMLVGAFNGFWVARVGLPSLAVTLAGYIGFRGVAKILMEDRSVTLPTWFSDLGQNPILGPFPLSMIIFFVLAALLVVLLQYTAFGRYIYIIGSNSVAARFSGVDVRRVKMMLFILSGVVASLAGLLYAARLGTVRASTAEGFELDIITMVLLGGVSIFGGSGTLTGVALSILIILNLRNGMGLASITGNTQTSVIGILLILSVLLPNWLRDAQTLWKRRQFTRPQPAQVKEDAPQTT